MTLFLEWNDLCSSNIDELLCKGVFPKDMHPTRQDYSVLASNTKLLIPQAAHSDESEASTNGNNSNLSNFCHTNWLRVVYIFGHLLI